MKFDDIVHGYIGVWLASLLGFIVIVTLIIIALPMQSWDDVRISVCCYLLIYFCNVYWEYRPLAPYDPKQLPFHVALWVCFLSPAVLAVAFILLLPGNIKKLIDSPPPKLKNFNDN